MMNSLAIATATRLCDGVAVQTQFCPRSIISQNLTGDTSSLSVRKRAGSTGAPDIAGERTAAAQLWCRGWLWRCKGSRKKQQRRDGNGGFHFHDFERGLLESRSL